MADAVSDHDAKMKKLFQRCREKKIKRNPNKFELKKTTMPYIGHVLTSNGVQADPAKIQAILKMKKPEDVAGVRHILGTVNYLAKFLPRLSEVSAPLRELTKKEQRPFHWSGIHDQAFAELKKLITQPPVLKYYEPNKPLTLQCDASDYGLGAALIQNGKPIAFASRALTSAERNHAQIEKELLAIVYGTERFHQYTYGRSVLVETDHKPLEMIHQKPLTAAPRRLQKMMMQLQNYDLTIQYKKGTEMFIANTLSRHNLESDNTEPKHVEDTISLEDINHLIASEMTTKKLREETAKDGELQRVKEYIQSGWPENSKQINTTLTPYFHIRDELAAEEGLLFRGTRLIIPKPLRKEMLQELHSAHQGVESTIRRARESVYWPRINQELKEHIRCCETCETYSNKQCREPLIPHEVPDRAWEKIACDIFECNQKHYLVTVDYHSDFFEVDCLKQQMKASGVIAKLKPHFARYGIPTTLISDNGPQFNSREFREFGTKYGFNHTTTSPYHHQSNGKVEAAVKAAEKIVLKCTASGTDPYLAILALRNTPQQVHGTSPAQRMFNRRTKTKLPTQENLLEPQLNQGAAESRKKVQVQQAKYYNRGTRALSPLKEGDMVRLQPTQLGQRKWKQGQVVKQVGRRAYKVICNGIEYIRNRRFLRKSATPEPCSENHSDDEYETASEKEVEETQGDEVTQETNTDPGETNSPVKTTRSGRVIKAPSRLGFEK